MYAGAMPLMFNSTILNGMGITGDLPTVQIFFLLYFPPLSGSFIIFFFCWFISQRFGLPVFSPPPLFSFYSLFVYLQFLACFLVIPCLCSAGALVIGRQMQLTSVDMMTALECDGSKD